MMLTFSFLFALLHFAGIPLISLFGTLITLFLFFHWSLGSSLIKSIIAGVGLGLLLGAFSPLPFGAHIVSLIGGIAIGILGKYFFRSRYLWGDLSLITGGVLVFVLLQAIIRGLWGEGGLHLSFWEAAENTVSFLLLLYGWFLVLRRREHDSRRRSEPYAV